MSLRGAQLVRKLSWLSKKDSKPGSQERDRWLRFNPDHRIWHQQCKFKPEGNLRVLNSNIGANSKAQGRWIVSHYFSTNWIVLHSELFSSHFWDNDCNYMTIGWPMTNRFHSKTINVIFSNNAKVIKFDSGA